MVTVDEETLDDLVAAAQSRADRIESGSDATDHTAYAAGYRDGAECIHQGILRDSE
jgi:hypothetical protein